MVRIGIPPAYFLDEMSLDEINEIIKSINENEKRELEKERLNWFHTYRAFGSDVRKPEDIVRFEWDSTSSRQGKRLSKEQINKKAKQAKKWLNNR